MKRIALFIPIAFASQMALAQTNEPTGLDAERNLAELGNSRNATMVRTYDNRYQGVRGTPFFNEDWAKATITTNNTIYENVDVKYNLYENELLYRKPDGKEFVLTNANVDGFVLRDGKSKQGHPFKKFPALAAEDAKLAQQFVLALHDGRKVQLVMVPQKLMVKANFKGPYSSGNKYDEFQDMQSYYLIGPEQAVQKVKLNKKSLLKALPDKQDQVEKYIATEGIDASTAAGWVKALAYYESL